MRVGRYRRKRSTGARGYSPRAPNASLQLVPRTTETERLSRVLTGGGIRQIILTHDRRDRPPWTAELRIDNKLVGLRAAKTLSAAVTAVQGLAP